MCDEALLGRLPLDTMKRALLLRQQRYLDSRNRDASIHPLAFVLESPRPHNRLHREKAFQIQRTRLNSTSRKAQEDLGAPLDANIDAFGHVVENDGSVLLD